LLRDASAVLYCGGLSPELITLASSHLASREIILKGVSSSRWLQTASTEQRNEDVKEAIEIARAAPEQFEVEADYELTRFAEAIEHIERPGRSGAVLISPRV
jgi:NADPH:quinone reductase